MFPNEKREWTSFTKKLKGIAKEGGRKYPIVNFEFDVQETEKFTIGYLGKDENGELIGTLLFGTDKMPTELEFFSIHGNVEIKKINLN